MKIKHLALTMATLACILIATLFYVKIHRSSKKDINLGVIEYFQLKNLNFDTITDKKELLIWLEKAEKNIWIELKETFNLTKQECDALKQSDKQDYIESTNSMKQKYSSNQMLSQNTINFIHTVMKEFDVKPETITILPWNSDVVASATDSLLFINEAQLNNNEPQTKKYLIGHELTHVLNKDHSTRYFIRNSTPNKPLNDNDSNNPINKLCQFHELRADILSSLKGLEYAEGAQCYMQQQIIKSGDLQFPHYPKFSLRKSLGIKIAKLHSQKPLA